jgi:tetratricopeptide (TPR) repeat protein
MDRTRTLRVLYVLDDGAPIRPPVPLATWAVDGHREGDGWRLMAPGRTVGLDGYEPEPVIVDRWLSARIAPFGRCVGPGEYRLEGADALAAFEAAIAPHLSAVDPSGSEEARRAATERDADRLVEVFPDDPLVRIARARAAAGGPRGAAFCTAEITRALAARRDAETLLAANYAHAEAGDRAAARALLGEVLDLEPTHAEAARGLRSQLIVAGLPEEELALDERLATTRRREAFDWHRRAVLLEGFGRLEEAESALTEAIALGPDRHFVKQILTDRGRLRAKLGRDAEALADLERTLPEYCSFPGYIVKAEVLYRLGRKEEAERILRWVLHAPKHAPAARALLGRLGFDRPEPPTSAD